MNLHRHTTVRAVMLLALLGTMPAGCGRVRQVHWLRGDFTVGSREAMPIECVYVSPDIDRIAGRSLYVEVEDPLSTVEGAARMTPKQDWPRWRADFAAVLADRMWQANVFSDVCAMNDPVPIADPELSFKVAVTEWHEGRGWLRYLVGFGFGATRVQWEGAILDTRTNQVYFAFADARAHAGGPNLGGFGGSHAINGALLIAEDLAWASEDLRDALRLALKASDPLGDPQSRHPTYRPRRPGAQAARLGARKAEKAAVRDSDTIQP